MIKLVKNIVKLVILTFAIIGFMSVGGWDFMQDFFKNVPFLHPSQETLLDKANKIADFSHINTEEYEISKAVNIFGYKAVVAEHNSSGQKFVVVDSGKKPILTKDDFKNDGLETKIQDATKILDKHFIHLKNVKVVKKSSMWGLSQTIPYAKIEAEPVNMPPVKKLTGIVGVAEKNGKDNLVVAINSDGKYSHIITEQFFKDVK